LHLTGSTNVPIIRDACIVGSRRVTDCYLVHFSVLPMSSLNTRMSKTRVIILGGGFAGVYAAMALERRARGRGDVELGLVNRENYFVFQPLLPEIVSGNIGITDTISPLRRLLPRTKLYIRDVDAVDLEKRRVVLSPGFWPTPTVIEYDHLVLALGTVTDFRGLAGLYEHALPFKTLEDAVVLRNHVLQVLQEASVETHPERRKSLLTFVVAGGGFSGVEVAAELNDFVRRLMRRDPELRSVQPQVVLVHTGDRLLDREFPPQLSHYAERVLRKRGIDVRLKTRLTAASPDAAVLSDGRVPTKTLVSTVPSFPNPLIDTLPLPKERGRIKVDRCLEVEGFENVWAAGDCALVPMQSEGFMPPTAQHAVRQAAALASNIAARSEGRELKPVSFEGLGKMGALGHRSAVAELFGRIRLSGWPAWLLWRTIYWSKLPGFERKMRLGISWALDLILPPEAVQLRLGGRSSIGQAHYETGEYVFRQGDLGDSLYIILKGQVDVLAEENGTARCLTSLGAGEYFGELALLNEHNRSASVRCTEATDLLVIRRGDFRALVTHLPGLHDSFRRVADGRERRPDASDVNG
jgi:NADH dehydrogenase